MKRAIYIGIVVFGYALLFVLIAIAFVSVTIEYAINAWVFRKQVMQDCEGVGWRGDRSCIYNAMSPQLQCAVNPEGNCSNCQHYEARLYVRRESDSVDNCNSGA